MAFLYGVTYTWRHVKKSETSHRIGRGVDNVHWVKKVIKKSSASLSTGSCEWTHAWGHVRRQSRRAVYETLVTLHAVRGRMRRMVKVGVHDFLVFTHRIGLRGGGDQRR
jgi:hypothetical protein